MEITQADLDYARAALGPDATDAQVRDQAGTFHRTTPEALLAEPTDEIQRGFLHAWLDLRERLVSADTNLRDLARDKPTDEFTRLHYKRHGVDAAYTVWENLHTQLCRAEIDPAGAWRTFTDQVQRLFRLPVAEKSFYVGVHLALTYQRGYGSIIDAPVIPNPHNQA